MIKITRKGAVSAAAVLSAAALVLTGCTVTDEGDQEGTPESGTLVISNWQWLEPGRGDVLWDGITKYNDDNPEVTLTRSETAYGQYADKLNTELGAGGGPDIFVILDSQFATLVDAGLVEPLDDAVKGADLNSSNEPMKVDGKQLGVTWEQVSYALLGNKNVMEAAGITELPTTIDELIADGEAVEATGADGFAVRHQMSEFDGWLLDFQSWIFGQDGAWSNGEELTIDSAANIKGVSEFQKVYDSGIMPIGDDASTFRTKFKENQLGFMIDNSGAALSFTSGGQITGTDIIAGPLPFPDAGAHQKLILAVNAKSENKELAKNFISWFVSEDGQAAIRPGLGASTLATDIPLGDDFVAANPWAEAYVALGADSRGTLIPGFETKTKAIMQFVMQAVERVVAQGEDPKTALGEAQQEATK